MSMQSDEGYFRPYWFVGASFGATDDQTLRFIRDGIWENGHQDSYLDSVRSIQPGDKIAIKSAYTRKRDLPFDNRGRWVSVMAIKATGRVKSNPGDGRSLIVDWTALEPFREWYFYTHRGTVWRVEPGDWFSDNLISFTFENREQDIDKFLNDPYWRDKYAEMEHNSGRFKWTQFYETVANKLLEYKLNRTPLVEAIYQIADKHNLTYLKESTPDGSKQPISDLDPFTIMGMFNRGLTNELRTAICNDIAEFLKIDSAIPIPDKFDGIPVLNNMNSWFFGSQDKRQTYDVDNLWELCSTAVDFADTNDLAARDSFINSFDKVSSIFKVGWKHTMGLYWIRPWSFPTLDDKSRSFIKNSRRLEINRKGPRNRITGSDYLDLKYELENRFQDDTFPVHSFPELSLNAWKTATEVPPDGPISDDGGNGPTPDLPDLKSRYTIENIIEEGCFIIPAKLKLILERLKTKKNLILQGPPGTGKTWLSKRLAYALTGRKDNGLVRAFQFHPNLTYEDFVRGFRPSGEGKLKLIDGPMMDMIKTAKRNPSEKYVIVIEEINRGNPAQIFGEMLTLLESDKRNPESAISLCYSGENEEGVYLPENLYLIGTMNIADRSLALVDLALRRRFAFIDLEPIFGEVWRDWVFENFGFDMGFLVDVESRVLSLNEEIASDSTLGPHFRIGHSFVTPHVNTEIPDKISWFRQVVETEIGPQLEEYWFDTMDKAREAKRKLLQGF